MSFNKATKVFSFLTTSGIAIGVTIGMIIFNGNKELLKKEEEQVLDNFDLELKKFENEEFPQQDQSDDDKDQEGESGADEGKSLEEYKDKEEPKEKGPAGSKGEKETAIEVDAEKGVQIPLGPESNSSQKGDLLIPSFEGGKEQIKLDYGEEKKVTLGQGESKSQPAPEKPASGHTKGEHAEGEECENCPDKQKVEKESHHEAMPSQEDEKTLAPVKEEKLEETGASEPSDSIPNEADGELEQKETEDLRLEEFESKSSDLDSDESDVDEQRGGQEAVAEGTQKSELEQQSGQEGLQEKDSPEMQDGQEQGQSEAMADKKEKVQDGSEENRGGGNGSAEESTNDDGSAIADQLETLVGLYGALGQAISSLRPKVS